jgi:16S rRNA (guanine527-N7)-methyltransferase
MAASMVPPDEFIRLGVSRESWERLQIYVALLQDWQTRINLIGASTVPDIWTRHILDSLQLMPHLDIESNQSVIDLGSGAGLPGLVLSIATNCSVELYESNARKAAFLLEAIRVTKAKARVHRIRIETLQSQHAPATANYVVARALAPLRTLLELSRPFFSTGSVGLFHKGQDVDAELTEARKHWAFTAVTHPSITSPKGVILEIRDLSHDSRR